VLWARDGKVEHVPSLKIKPVDTVGAGDTFCGYLAQGLDAGMGSPRPSVGQRWLGRWPVSNPARSRRFRSQPMSTPVSDLSEAADPLDKQLEEAVGVDVLDDKGILGATGDLPPVDNRGAEGKIRAGFYFHVALAT
jgi:hypothetical protein